MALTKVNGDGVGTLSSGLTLTSDDPTITMTDSSGTNDIATIQATSGALIVTARDGSADGEIIFKKTDGSSTDETMRIDSNGRLLLRKASGVTSGSCVEMERDMTSGVAMEINDTDSSGTNNAVHFRRGGSVVGKITIGASSTGYVTSSDYRLKQDVKDMTGAIDRVKALAPKRFQFIADADTTVDGFLAHEAQAVVPEAVTGTKDEVDEDGNAVMQGIDQSKLVPLLTAALKESIAKIEALETRVKTLEDA